MSDRPIRVQIVGTIRVRIVGTPAPQGSKVHIRDGIMRESSRMLPAWRGAVIAATHAVATRHGTIRAPVVVACTFIFRKPARTQFPDWPVGRNVGDLDKLCRAVGDGLEHGGLIGDDKMIVHWDAVKRWARPDEPPGAIVRLWEAGTTAVEVGGES